MNKKLLILLSAGIVLCTGCASSSAAPEENRNRTAAAAFPGPDGPPAETHACGSPQRPGSGLPPPPAGSSPGHTGPDVTGQRRDRRWPPKDWFSLEHSHHRSGSPWGGTPCKTGHNCGTVPVPAP